MTTLKVVLTPFGWAFVHGRRCLVQFVVTTIFAVLSGALHGCFFDHAGAVYPADIDIDLGWLCHSAHVFCRDSVRSTVSTLQTDWMVCASSVTVLVAVFFTVVAVGMNSGIEPVTCAVVGALLGFLLFNVYPASVFMGDTGSLALGGFVAATAYMLQMPLFILIVGLIYLVEVLSVIIQVTFFKADTRKTYL